LKYSKATKCRRKLLPRGLLLFYANPNTEIEKIKKYAHFGVRAFKVVYYFVVWD
jgi:hypothetical protein